MVGCVETSRGAGQTLAVGADVHQDVPVLRQFMPIPKRGKSSCNQPACLCFTDRANPSVVRLSDAGASLNLPLISPVPFRDRSRRTTRRSKASHGPPAADRFCNRAPPLPFSLALTRGDGHWEPQDPGTRYAPIPTAFAHLAPICHAGRLASASNQTGGCACRCVGLTRRADAPAKRLQASQSASESLVLAAEVG